MHRGERGHAENDASEPRTPRTHETPPPVRSSTTPNGLQRRARRPIVPWTSPAARMRRLGELPEGIELRTTSGRGGVKRCVPPVEPCHRRSLRRPVRPHAKAAAILPEPISENSFSRPGGRIISLNDAKVKKRGGAAERWPGTIIEGTTAPRFNGTRAQYAELDPPASLYWPC